MTNVGFACLKFTMDAPQYYMYGYLATVTGSAGDSFTATANGDLNGDTVQSTFMIVGSVANNNVLVGPNIIETDPEE